MKAMVVGLPEKEAFAVSLLLNSMRPDWECQSNPAGDCDAPADLYVLDADVWREHHGHQAMIPSLQKVLREKPAVLLTAPTAPRDDARAQAEAAARDWGACGWVVLRRPYRAAAMREAVELAERHASAVRERGGAAEPFEQERGAPRLSASTAAAEAAHPTETTQGATTRFSSSFFASTGPVSGDTPPTGSSSGLPPPEITAAALTVEAFAACVATSPSPECRQFLGALASRLQQPGAFEMTFTLINGLLFDSANDWVATNTPMSVVRMVAHSRSLGAHVKAVDLDPQVDPRSRALQRGMQIHSLGGMLHALARMAECRLPER